MTNEEKKLNWKYEKMQNWSKAAQEGKKGYERLMCTKDNPCHYCISKNHTELEQIAIVIWRDGKQYYAYSSIGNKGTPMYSIIKNENKLLLMVDNGEIHSYGFENDNSDFHETAMIIYSNDCETNIILASNKSTKLERLTTFYDINSETTEQFILNLVKNKTEGEVSKSNEIIAESFE